MIGPIRTVLAVAVLAAFLFPLRPQPLAEAQPADTVESLVAEFSALPGRTAFLVLENGKEIGASNPDVVLGVGSSFKMAILLTLRQQIAAGRHAWDEVLPLKEGDLVPGGPLFDWQPGTPMTIATYAGFMISRSDNTGTDTLFNLLGREAIEANVPARNRPLMNAHDFYFLKNLNNVAYANRWRSGNEAERRALLTEIDLLPLNLKEANYSEQPYALDIEWHFTTRELCDLIAQVQDLPSMGIINLMTNKDDWAHSAFKGGSEPGALAGTSWVRAADGRSYCVSATWNNPAAPVEESAFGDISFRLFDVLLARTTP